MSSSSNVTRRELLASLGAAASVGSIQAGSTQAADLPFAAREMWGFVRAQQLVDPLITYFDTATIGPGLRAALATEYRQLEQFNTDTDGYQRTFLATASLGSTMRRLAALLGCQPNDFTITQGATEALSLVANGLTLTAGDEVIVTAQAHPSAIYPWLLQAQRRGVVVKQIALPIPLERPEQALDLIAASISDKTRVLAFSHVQYIDGAVLPVANICALARQRNIFTVVDGAQACGSVNIAVTQFDCDFYATSLHKWLNGPYGLGLLYIRPNLLGMLSPSIADGNLGWNIINRFGQANIDDEQQRVTWPATLAKFGCNVRLLGPKLKALESVLDFRDQLGADRIEARIRELAIYARLRLQSLSDYEILSPAAPGMWAGILAFHPRISNAQELMQRLKRSNKIVTAAVIHPAAQSAPELSAIRVSLHIYNLHDDVERLIRALQ